MIALKTVYLALAVVVKAGVLAQGVVTSAIATITYVVPVCHDLKTLTRIGGVVFSCPLLLSSSWPLSQAWLH